MATNDPQFRRLIKFILIGAVCLIGLICFFGTFEKNDDQNWQVVQYPNGTVRIVDNAGYYPKWFGSVYTYPRNWQVSYDGTDIFKVVFNDSGIGDMSTMVRFSSPITIEGKREFHRQFGGNQDNVEAAVWAHISNALKSSGPIMSASEHQSARRSEFDQLVQEQLNKGLFETRKVEKILHDQTDEKGKPITVYATEIILDKNGNPTVANESPLSKLGLAITQFSVTHVEYDKTTQAQFEQKKQAFLAAESSKAQREKEVQERLMVEEKGKREKAESEAIANVQRATLVIAAQREKEVAELKANQEKNVAETNSAKLVAVASQAKIEAETKANQQKVVAELQAMQELEVAKLGRLAAEEDAKKQIVLADAQKKSLELGGAISERDRVLAEIESKTRIGVAEHLSKINVPTNVIAGAGGATGADPMSNLINLNLLERLGSVPKSAK